MSKIKELQWEAWPRDGGHMIDGASKLTYRMRAELPWGAVFLMEDEDVGTFHLVWPDRDDSRDFDSEAKAVVTAQRTFEKQMLTFIEPSE